MTRFTNTAALIALGFAAALPATAHAGNSPLGVWMNDTGRGAIEISECGSRLCGHVVWTKSEADREKGCRKKIIGNAKKVSKNMWDNGWIYSPERKKKYSLELKPLSGERLRVKGYAGSKFFSKTMIWTRAPADLERCDADTAQVIAANSGATPPTTEKRAVTAVPASTDNDDYKPVAPVARETAPNNAPVENNTEVAEADEADDASIESGPLGNIDIGKYFKKGNDGECDLNTPWIKLKFKCD